MAGRKPKAELLYYRRRLDYYDDYKIMDLMIEKGPLGVTVYDIIVLEIFRNGFYLAVPLDKLVSKIIRTIGNRWVPNKQTVVQVIQYCADIGLFDDDLLQRNVLTSVELQEIYAEVTVRRRFQNGEYWLLEKKKLVQPLINAPKNDIHVTEMAISATEIPINVCGNSQEYSIEDNIYIGEKSDGYFIDEELNSAFLLYLSMRGSGGTPLSSEQIAMLKEELEKLSEKKDERIAIVKKATMSSWKSFYPISRGKQAKYPGKRKDKFNNFEGRSYDMGSLEMQLLGSKKEESEESKGNI